tara:strand:+ start:142 stop:417 length:276 start_codon:yes stop_codon:yes gene_type:complete
MTAAIIVVTVMSVVSLCITIEMIKYNTQLKKYERLNNENTPIINQEKYNLKGSEEVLKNKVQNKRKPSSPKKKNVKPKLNKKHARQDKKKV